MKNFKQIAFGLILGAMVVGFSAFTSAKSKSPRLTTVYYGLNEAGTIYTRSSSDPSGNCHEASLDNCTISYPTDKGASFSSSMIPAGSTVVSGPGWVNP